MCYAPRAFNCPPANLNIRQTPPTINIVGQSSLSKNAESLKIHKNLADAILYKV